MGTGVCPESEVHVPGGARCRWSREEVGREGVARGVAVV